jgi:hypothetical protein
MQENGIEETYVVGRRPAKPSKLSVCTYSRAVRAQAVSHSIIGSVHLPADMEVFLTSLIMICLPINYPSVSSASEFPLLAMTKQASSFTIHDFLCSDPRKYCSLRSAIGHKLP